MILTTVISFRVRVPVLSEQIMVVLPRVSTEASLRTMAFLRVICVTPRARVIVKTAGSPSGMAETARLTEVMNISSRSSWRTTPVKNTKMQRTMAMTQSMRPSFSIFCFKGGGSTSTDWTIPAIFPNSVFIPVSMTTAPARPPVTRVPVKIVFILSEIPSSDGSTPILLATGVDSPVSEDSSTRRFTASSNRASAGIRLPASRRITSPGTSSLESMDFSRPPLSTMTWGDTIFLRASMAFSARYS